MIVNKALIGFLSLTLLFFSCKKEHSIEESVLPEENTSTWKFTESGTEYSGPTDTAVVQTVGAVKSLTVIGTQTGGGELLLQVVGTEITAGSSYNGQYVFFQYSQNGDVVFRSVPAQGSDFSISITEIDSSHVKGTFTGSVEDPQGTSHSVSGEFSAKLRNTSEVDPGNENGQLTVWAKQICNDGGTIEVKVAGQTGQVIDAMVDEPACGADGTATFTLPWGNYVVEAICGTDTLRYNVTVGNDCNFLEVDFQNPPLVGDYLPLMPGSSWTYTDLPNQTTQQTISVNGNASFEARDYTKLESTTGDIFYYRKDNGVYFEYKTLDFEGVVGDPPSLEIEILHDNLDAGQSWESVPVPITVSQIPVTVKLVSTITRRDYSDTFNGVQYDDLIEVDNQIYFSADGGVTFQPSDNSFINVFAKGKGIVYYYDLGRQTDWGVTQITLGQ